MNLSNEYASLVIALCSCIKVKKMASQMKPYLLSDCFQVPLWDFEAVKKGWAGALLSAKCCCFVQRLSWKCHTIWTSLSEENKEDDDFDHLEYSWCSMQEHMSSYTQLMCSKQIKGTCYNNFRNHLTPYCDASLWFVLGTSIILATPVSLNCILHQLLLNKSDISYLKTSRAFDVEIHSRALLAAVVCWLATL